MDNFATPETRPVFHAPKRRWLRYSLWTLLLISIPVLAFLLVPRPRLDDEWIDDTVTPVQTIFHYTVAEPLSITASEVQGGGHTWQGYSVWLRFHPSKPLAEILLQKGYTETPFQDVAWRFKVDPRFQDRFSPEWNPSSVKHPRCFTRQARSSWTTSGEDQFLVDEDTGLVYFYGIGT